MGSVVNYYNYNAEIFCINHEDQSFFYIFEIIIHVLFCFIWVLFRFIWIPMLFHGQYKYFYSVGTDIRRVRIGRLQTADFDV